MRELNFRSRIGGYNVIRVVGKGGMGIVYLAEHAGTGQRVALKTLSVRTPRLIQRLRTEIAALQTLDHPNVVSIVEDGVADGVPWYAMSLIEGRSLRDYFRDRLLRTEESDAGHHVSEVRTGSWEAAETLLQSVAAEWVRENAVRDVEEVDEPSTWMGSVMDSQVLSALDGESEDSAQSSEAIQGAGRRSNSPAQVHRMLDWFAHLADALAYLHSLGIVHGDLKPSNVIVNGSSQAILMDFGLADRLTGRVRSERLDTAGVVAGTTRYMSPERLRGGGYDGRSDLYALGCMLYELVTGRVPFDGASPVVIARKHLENQPSPPSSSGHAVPAQLEDLILRLLAKDPRKRPCHALEVLATLQKLGVTSGGTRFDRQGTSLCHTSLLGRSELMKSLLNSLEVSRSGKGQIVVLEGESGVGKSRLLAEIVRRSRRHDFAVLRVQGRRLVGQSAVATPLGALRPMFQVICDVSMQGYKESERLVGVRGPVLRPYFTSFSGLPGQEFHCEAPDLPPDASRNRLFSVLWDTLWEFADSRPLLLLIDDAQWIDGLTLEFLRFVFPRLADSACFALAAYRSDEVPQDMLSLNQLESVTSHYVPRLDKPAQRELIGELLGTLRPNPALVDYAVRHADGNAFFVEECLRSAIVRGFLCMSEEGRWTFDDDRARELLRSPLPESLDELVGLRLKNLSRDARAACRAASVLGRTFVLAHLLHLLTWEDSTLYRVVSELRRREVFERHSDREDDTLEVDEERFVHDKLLERAYAELSPELRCAYHGRAARYLAEKHQNWHVKDLGRLAWHWEKGRSRERARKTYFEAFRQSAKHYAHEEAESFLLAGLRLTGEDDETSISAVIDFVNGGLRIQGRTDESEVWIRGVLEKTSETHLGYQHAKAHMALGSLMVRSGRNDEALEASHRALNLLRKFGDRISEGITLGNIAIAQNQAGRYEEALAGYRQALQIARDEGDRVGEARHLGNLGGALYNLGRDDEALTHIKEALAIVCEVGNRRGEGVWRGMIGTILKDRGQYEEAFEHQYAALKIAREIGDRRGEGFKLGYIGSCHFSQGQLEDAVGHWEDALEIACEVSDLRIQAYWLVSLARATRLQGNLRQARSFQVEAFDILKEIGADDRLGECLCEVGHWKLHHGEPADVEIDAVREIVQDLQLGPKTDLVDALERLQRASVCVQEGARMFFGQSIDDLPSALRESAEKGQGTNGSS